MSVKGEWGVWKFLRSWDLGERLAVGEVFSGASWVEPGEMEKFLW